MPSPRPTLADVAREAGVSLMTVSRVVNNKEGVGTEQRQRIEAIIERLGYRPSGVARSLVTQRTGSIGLVVPDVSNPFFPDIIHGVEKVAYEQGYSLLLCDTNEDPQREFELLRVLAEKWVDGVVLCSSRLLGEDLANALAPHPAAVLVNREPPPAAQLAGSMGIDDALGGHLILAHLLSLGHRSIGILAGPVTSFSGQKRIEGARRAAEAAGLAWSTFRLAHCLPAVDAGRAAAHSLLTAQPSLTALVCYNDLVAVGALQAAAQLGRRVPQDLAITGYDDIHLAALVTPSLTTCRVQRAELGRRAAQILFDALASTPAQPTNVLIPPELIIRNSA